MPGSRRRRFPTAWLVLGAGAALAGLSLQAGAAETPRALLERMADAVEKLSYEGELVHTQGGDTSVLSITHQVKDGHVTERIICEDSGREIIRDGEEVTGIFPDQHAVLVGPRDGQDQPRSPLRERLSGVSSLDDSLYLLSFVAPERIAGRDTKGVTIRPRDSFRYGYRIWLDRATYMPLKTLLVDEQGHVLELIQFTKIRLPAGRPVAPGKPPPSVRRAGQAAPAPVPDPAADAWERVDRPPGFRLAVHRARAAADARNGLRQVVYSDGLATVSLFVEPAVAASEQAEGLSEIGALNAYTTTINGHMVTAVGEVPARTVKMFARSVRFLDPVPAQR